MKLTDTQTGLLCTAVFTAIIFGGITIVEGPEAQYIITDKQESKISYQDLNGNSEHVMFFDADTAGIGFDVYSNVSVGDTISGHARTMQKPVASPWYNHDGKPNVKTSSVYSINGTDIRNIQLKARYANWLREMKQKQR